MISHILNINVLQHVCSSILKCLKRSYSEHHKQTLNITLRDTLKLLLL